MKFKLLKWIKGIFRVEKCIKCNANITKKDRETGGIAYINGKSYHYCVKCSQEIVINLLSGEEPDFPEFKEEIEPQVRS